MRLLVARQGVGRWPETFHGVARLALVPIWGSRKLSRMRILVAIEAGAVRYLVASFFSGREMTLGAFHGSVFASQRVSRFLMTFHREGRWPEFLFGMAALAIVPLELSPVRIGCVTIGAVCKRHRPLEIAIPMAFFASCIDVRAMQRKFRRAVIETGRHLGNVPPSRGCMAVLAGRGERSTMRVLVAISARVERDIFVTDNQLRGSIAVSRTVALIAGDLFMQAGKWVLRALVIEPGCRSPALRAMASRAVRAELSSMLIGMTSRALRR